MLEEEAKKYAQDMAKYYESAHDSIPSQFEKYLCKAVEYGYNKANDEWHYVDKEGLPEDKFKVLVQYVNGDYDIAFNFAGTWHGTSGNELRGAYAWKEIIPPKENKQ